MFVEDPPLKQYLFYNKSLAIIATMPEVIDVFRHSTFYTMQYVHHETGKIISACHHVEGNTSWKFVHEHSKVNRR